MTAPSAPVVAVLCADHRPAAMDPVENAAEVRYVTADRLREGLRGAEVLFLWDFMSSAVQSVWNDATDLKWIHIASAGVDRLLFPELTDSAVVVTNSRGVFERPIAEFVLGTVLAFAKDMPGTWTLQQRRHWQHRETERIEGQTAMVIGTGPIGREIARLLSAVGMRIQGIGRRARDGDPDFGQIRSSADLADVVGAADYVVVAAPLTDDTRHLIDRPVLRRMKPSARLINVGRGPIVDEDAVLDALTAGDIAGAALDVFPTEPLDAGHPLWHTPGAMISPHMSGDTIGWLDRLAELFVVNFDRWRRGEPLTNVVDKQLGYVSSDGAT